MEVTCYVCNEKTDDWQQNLLETNSLHSNTPIFVFIDKFLDNHVSHRNMNDESNCICSNCFVRICSYDWLCIKLKEQDNELRALIRKTEDSFTNNLFKNEFEFINAAALDEIDCATMPSSVIKTEDTSNMPSDVIKTEDTSDGTKEIEIVQAMIMKTEKPNDYDYNMKDVVDDDIYKARSVDIPLYLTVTESPTRYNMDIQLTQLKRCSNEDKCQLQVVPSSVPNDNNPTQKQPFLNDTSNSTDNHQLKQQQVTQGRKKFDCHHCGSNFSNKFNLKEHQQTKCAEMIRKYICSFCDRTFSRPSKLRDHLEDVHKQIVTSAYAKKQMKFYRNSDKKIQKQMLKEKHAKITCKCDVLIRSGINNFKRHVKHIHGHTNWEDYIRSVD